MKIIRGVRKLRRLRRPVVTVGVFDGLHRGHRGILRLVRRRSRAIGGTSCVVTFDPHPFKVLHPGRILPRISSLEHRIGMIEGEGIAVTVIIRFSGAFARMPAERFVKEVLVRRLGVAELVVGENFHFGTGRSGGAEALRRMGRRHGFRLSAVPVTRRGGGAISSTRIRGLIVSGELDKASALLGRRVSILGTVIGGRRVGRRIGFPTANIDPHHEAIPPCGVYAVCVLLGAKRYGGVVNIGVRPTFKKGGPERDPSIEAHIFALKGSLYGRSIELEFVKRIRSERRFSSVAALREQIAKDVAAAGRILGRRA